MGQVSLEFTLVSELFVPFQLTIQFMARVLCISGEDIDELRRRTKRCRKCLMEKKTRGACACNNGNASVTSDLIATENGEDKVNSTNRNTIYDNLSNQPQSSPYQLGNLENQFSEVRKTMHRIESRFEQKMILQREETLNVREWKACAMVLDRFFFILYVLLIALSLFVLFPRPEDELKRVMEKDV